MQDYLIDLYSKNKYSWLGLISLLVLISIALITIFEPFLSKGITSFANRFIIYLIINFVVGFIWCKKTQFIPNNKTNKPGIVICINAENERERTLIKIDLHQQIKDLINTSGFGHEFEIISLADHIAKRYLPVIEEEQVSIAGHNYDGNETKNKKWLKLKNHTNGIFYIYGYFSVRTDEEEKYILDIHSIVLHKKISKEKSNEISNNMNAVLPRKIIFNVNREVSGITVTAKTLYIGVRFIVGMASLFSDKYELAVNLFNNLSTEINNNPIYANFPNKQLYVVKTF